MHTALIAARMVRENRNPEIWSWTTVHPSRNRRWLTGPSHRHRLLRILGPAADT